MSSNTKLSVFYENVHIFCFQIHIGTGIHRLSGMFMTFVVGGNPAAENERLLNKLGIHSVSTFVDTNHFYYVRTCLRNAF